MRWARNFEFAADSVVLMPDDEVAVIPPVSGGAPLAELTSDPIDVPQVIARVASPDVGATVLFVGTVRNASKGKRVAQLHYEAYEPMTSLQLERIAGECRNDYAACNVAVTHRYGTLAVGDIAVVIATASPHRDDAFLACRQILERIKTDVPLWKREQTTDGDEWVGWGGG